MGIFFVYILKASVCQALFYLFYRLFLSRETFHRFNRVALLLSLILAFALPLLEISVKQQSEVHRSVMTLEQWLLLAEKMQMNDGIHTTVTQGASIGVQLILLIYFLGFLFFVLRSIYGVANMGLLLKSGKRYYVKREGGLLKVMQSGDQENPVYSFVIPVLDDHCKMKGDANLIVHHRNISAFSWMNNIVLSQKDLEENGTEILIHELAHIYHRHSWDLLITDCCIFLQWFNPASWLLKQELQNIHEYEADETVLEAGVDEKHYQLLLIKKAVGSKLFSIANNFNHSKLKKRISMMLKEKSNPWARLKYLYVFPLAAIAVVAFARPEVTAKAELISKVKMNDLKDLVDEKLVDNSSVLSQGADAMSLPTDTLKKSKSLKAPSIQSLPVEKKEADENIFTVRGAAQPLFIINGKEADRDVVSALDPQRIESINVLKNKSAASIYGDRGKNGVVLITLKKDIKNMNADQSATKEDQIINQRDKASTIGKEVTYYVDGTKKSAGQIKEISPDAIESVNVVKDGDQKGSVYISTKEKSGKGKMTVNGTVVNAQDKPIEGAIVKVENSTLGTITDSKGSFQLQVPNGASLNISFIGMKSLTQKAESQIKVTLIEE